MQTEELIEIVSDIRKIKSESQTIELMLSATQNAKSGKPRDKPK